MSGKMNVFEIVTDRILACLDKGVVPWRKTWRSANGQQHSNLVSKKPYQGINTILTAMSALSNGYGSPWWVSYKQAAELGGNVRKGEKGTIITFCKTIPNKKDPDGKPFFMRKYSTVFNVEQCDGLEGKIPTVEAVADFTPIEAAQAILDNYQDGPGVIFGPDPAYYPPTDTLYMPYGEQFVGSEQFYKAAFHEAIHSTGHADRLKRDGIVKPINFGSDPYAQEELVAELGAAFLAAEAGILCDDEVEQSAAYIAGWKRKLVADPKCIIKAASDAQKGTDHILGIERSYGAPDVTTETTEALAEAA